MQNAEARLKFLFRVEPGIFSLQGNSGCANPMFLNFPSREQILRDMRVLYECLLHPQTMVKFGPEGRRECALSAASKLLDCKQFVKNYKPETTSPLVNSSAIYLFCQVEFPVHLSEEQVMRPPPELIAFSSNATISDLKAEVSKVFQEVYIMLKGFQAEELVDYRGVEDSTQVKLLFPSLVTVRIQGRCPLKNGLGRFRLERGVERGRWNAAVGLGMMMGRECWRVMCVVFGSTLGVLEFWTLKQCQQNFFASGVGGKAGWPRLK